MSTLLLLGEASIGAREKLARLLLLSEEEEE
jgi:hypothetical protein